MQIFKKDEHKLRSKKPPKLLFLAELLIMLILIRYTYNAVMITYPVHISLFGDIVNYLNIIVTMILSVLAASAMMGITSSKPAAWCKVVRSAIIMFIMAIIQGIATHLGYFTLTMNYGITASFALMAIIILVMFAPHVRRYYLPPMYDMPPLKEWIISMALFRQLINVDRYEFTYGGAQGEEVDLDLTKDPSSHLIPDFKPE